VPLPRLIPCLDVTGGRVVKGVNFVRLRDVGDPVELGQSYSHAGADELVFLDISATPRRAAEWARECEARGAGEILLTSIDADGTRAGYDLELTREVADAVSLPVIASGGAGNAQHVADALHIAQAALLASILHEDPARLFSLRAELRELGVLIRDAA
jgi:imidazole glycerol phosphate synthase subunit HisF